MFKTAAQTAIGGFIKQNAVQIIIAVLCAVALGALATCERENIRTEERLVQTGKKDGQQTVTIQSQQEVLNDAQAYKDASERPSDPDVASLRVTNDRCTRSPASCQ